MLRSVRALIHYTRQIVCIVDMTLNTVQLGQEKNVCLLDIGSNGCM
jgi:hypothetical protein